MLVESHSHFRLVNKTLVADRVLTHRCVVGDLISLISDVNKAANVNIEETYRILEVKHNVESNSIRYRIERA